MPYTLNSLLLDLGGWFASGFPAMTGRFFAPPPASGSSPAPLDSASNNPSSPSQPMTLTFSSPAVPPASGTFTLHVTDNATGGDLYRSGVMSSLPPSPGLLTLITAQTAPIPTARINAEITAFAPASLPIPTGVQVAAGILTLGTLIPLAAAVTSITPATGGAPLTFTVSGTVTSQRFWFARVTSTFTYTFTLSITPSGDSANPGRVVAVSTPASTLGGNTLNPLYNTMLGPLLGVLLAGFAEPLVNNLIFNEAQSVLSEQGFRMSPSATLSARRVTVTPAGVAVQAAISDAHGPGVLALPGNLRVDITPAPSTAVNVPYTISVHNSASRLPVAGAAVSIRNFSASGTTQTLGATTDAAGIAVITATLNPKITFGIRLENGERVRVRFFTPPVLRVTAPGFRDVEVPLLEDIL